MAQNLFLGRTEEQQQFRWVLRSQQPAWLQRHLPTLSKPFFKQKQDERNLPFLLLFHGEGGMGKSSLMRRLRQIVETEPSFKPQFNLLFLDWESQQNLTLDLKVGHDNIRPETVLSVLHKAMVDAGWGSYFESYRKLVDKLKGIEAKLDRELKAPLDKDAYASVRKLGAQAIAWVIRVNAAGTGGSAAVSSPVLEPALETAIQVGTELLDQTKLFVHKVLTPDEYEVYAQPHERLAEALGKGMAELAKRKPLVMLLDTYEIVDRPECDYTLRAVIRCGGNRVVWAIAGRANLADSEKRGSVYFQGYRRDFPEDRVYARGMKEFSLDEIQQYFNEQVSDRPIAISEAEALAQFSLGIPFVISEAAAIWREGTPISEIVAPVSVQLGSTTAHEQVVKATSERFLVHCFGAKKQERDLLAVYALAMLRGPNVELLKAMLNVADLERELQALRERYSFIWVEKVRLDEKLAGFVREYLLAEVRRTSPMVQQMNDRALTWLPLVLEDLNREIADTAERLQDEEIADTITDLTYHSFWQSEEADWRYLVPRFVEGWQYNRSWMAGLLKLVEQFKPMLKKDGQRRLKLMSLCLTYPYLEETETLFAELEKLSQRKWLDGEGREERQAILQLRKGELLHWQMKYKEALQIYLEIEKRLPENTAQLRKSLAGNLYDIGWRLVFSKSGNAIASPEAEEAFLKAVKLVPDDSDSWFRLGVARTGLQKYEEAIAAYRKAIELQPNFADAYYTLGIALQKQNQ